MRKVSTSTLAIIFIIIVLGFTAVIKSLSQVSKNVVENSKTAEIVKPQNIEQSIDTQDQEIQKTLNQVDSDLKNTD